ncbi:LCP family protein, partial [Enorma massiliensis]|uniref:LCP family protein n=1 Tax=Enorma massiliensis TaxID=1472761 RepID=UPI00195BE790
AMAVRAVSEFAGVPISHFVSVHFEELEEIVDMLGGVWVDVPESFSAGNGGMSFKAGNQLLTGEQALAYARERYHVSGGDFGRAQAQRQIVEAVIRQVLA